MPSWLNSWPRAERMIFGALSSTRRACGSRTCRCHHGGPKHGPFWQISFRGPHGKTTGCHVPRDLVPAVREGKRVAAFQELARELAEMNRQARWTEYRQRRQRQRTEQSRGLQ